MESCEFVVSMKTMLVTINAIVTAKILLFIFIYVYLNFYCHSSDLCAKLYDVFEYYNSWGQTERD